MTPKAQERRAAVEARATEQYVAKVQRLLGHLIYNRTPKADIIAAKAEGKAADAYAAEVAAREPVGRAVHPLKAEAVKAANERAQAVVKSVTENLIRHGMDLNAAAPYPFNMSAWDNRAQAARAKNALYSRLTRDDPQAKNSHCMNAPYVVVMSPDGIEHFINQAEQIAAAEYDAFICKLVNKIGDCDSATLDGSHVWAHSILTVTKPTGVERWKTQQIWNISKLGNEFPQWPTRLMKG
jgi:hypothetical protein